MKTARHHDGPTQGIIMHSTNRKAAKLRVPILILISMMLIALIPGRDIFVYAADSAFESAMSNQGFPESYKPYLRSLHSAHPNWSFVAGRTGLDWNYALDRQCVRSSLNLVENISDYDALKSTDRGDYDIASGTYISKDGNYVSASRKTVAHFMDPRYYLQNDRQIFAFIDLRYNAATQTMPTLSRMTAGTYLSAYNATLMNAGRTYGVSPLMLASTIFSEHGRTGTSLTSGTVPGYAGYYNFFNFNAFATGSDSAVVHAAKYAVTRNWNTPEKSITEGAAMLAGSYTASNQYTLYLKRFNVMNGGAAIGTNQYLTLIYGTAIEARILSDAYRDLSNSSLVFYIPVYNNMPTEACPYPEGHDNIKYLKSLSVSSPSLGSLTLSPSFGYYTGSYSLSVPYETDSVTVNAVSVSQYAHISGTGTVSLNEGQNTFRIVCTSEAGESNAYTLTVNREDYTSYLVGEVAAAHVHRIYGPTRIETSLKTADELLGTLGLSKFGSCIIASANDYPDALSASYLAYVKHCPILLVSGSSVNAVTAYVKQSVAPNSTVYILGGPTIVPSSVKSALPEYNVKPLYGKNRYETNLKVLEEAGVNGEDIIVCSGLDFADALSASSSGLPIMLTSGTLSDEQTSFIASHGSGKTYIIGGISAVPESVEYALSSGYEVHRIGGDNRYMTSANTACEFFGGSYDTVQLAYGLDFPDGLCAGPLSRASGRPLLLAANYNTADAKAYALASGTTDCVVFGGPGLISDRAAVSVIYDLP